MARRKGGYYQAILMVAGFLLTMGYLLIYLAAVVRYLGDSAVTETSFRAAHEPHRWALWAGLGLCFAAWWWALASSLQMLKRTAGGPGDRPAGPAPAAGRQDAETPREA